MSNADDGVERREQILAFVTSYVEAHGHSPTVREIAAGVGLASPGPCHRQLERLVEEGRLTKQQVTSRRFVYALADPKRETATA